MSSRSARRGTWVAGLVVGILTGVFAFNDGGSVNAANKKKPLFEAKYDATGTRVLNVPDMAKDPEGFAKYWIWTKDANKDHKLSAEEAGMAKKAFTENDTSGDNFLDVKEVMNLIKNELAKKEALAKTKK